jgi:hypothetical protein
MKVKLWKLLDLVLIFLLLLSSSLCSDAGPAHAKGTEPVKYLAVYYTASSSAGTTYFDWEGQTYTFKNSGGGVFCYIPELNTTTLVHSYTSPEWAPGYVVPYTVDDRVFLVEINTGNHFSDYNEHYYEVDLTNGTELELFGGYNYDDGSYCNYAVVNDSLYYQPPAWNEVLYGWIGGGLWVQSLSSGSFQKTMLLGRSDPDNYGSLYSAGSRLFRFTLREDSQVIDANEIDLTTGKILKQQQLHLSTVNNKKLTKWDLIADQCGFYIAAQYKPDDQSPATIYLLRLPLTSFDNEDWSSRSLTDDFWNSNLVYTAQLSNKTDEFVGAMANGGKVLLNLNNNTALVYDCNTGNVTTVQFPSNIASSVTPQLLEVIQLTTPTITLQSLTTSVNPGHAVTLSGTITPSATGTINLLQSVNGSDFQQIDTVALTNGVYSYQYTIPGEGNYTFRTSFSGNSQLRSAQSSTVTVNSVQTTLPDYTLYIVAVIVVLTLVAIGALVLSRRKRVTSRFPPPPPPPSPPR